MIDVIDVITFKNVFRVLIFVIMFGYNFFALMLMLRIRILADTLKSSNSKLIVFLAVMHEIIVLGGSILVGFLILF